MSAAEGVIEIFVGEVGSGKSLVAVGGRILPHLAAGGIVCTNIPLMLYPWSSLRYNKSYPGAIEILKKRFEWDLQEGQLITLPRDCFDKVHHMIPAGTPANPVLLVLDEVLEGFDSMDRNDNATRLREVLSFIRHCRHLSVNMVMILQTFAELNNRVRTKASKIWLLRDTNKMRVPVIRCPFPIRNMILAQWWNTKGTELFEQHWISKAPWVFACYDTGDMSLTQVRCGLGQGFDYRGKGKRKGMIMTKNEKMCVFAVAALAVVGLCLAVKTMRDSSALRKQIEILASRPVASESMASVASKEPAQVHQEPQAFTNEPLRVVAVVNERVGLSSGRWVKVGESVASLGVLLFCDPSSGQTSWSKDLKQTDIFL
jgi:hypothetical protein